MKEKLKATIISVSLIVLGFVIGNIVFHNFVDIYIVPLTRMRPIMAVLTTAIFIAPGLVYAIRKKSF